MHSLYSRLLQNELDLTKSTIERFDWSCFICQMAVYIIIIMSASGSYVFAAPVEEKTVIINRTTADRALIDIGRQYNALVLFPTDVVKYVEVNSIAGKHTLQEALDLMLSGTGLIATVTEEGVIAIKAMPELMQEIQERKLKYFGSFKKFKIKPNMLATASVLAASMGAQASALAEEENKNEVFLEEIMVTAQKRESNIQDTPLSISAMSGDMMAKVGISNIEDLQFFVPGITITNDSMAIINIRGIGTSSFGVATDPSSTIYIDGIYQPRPTTAYQDMFDIERVELLRGPQGVLFGRNSTGGALSIITKSPSNELEGSAAVTIGNYNKRTFSGTISGPLSDKVRGRITLVKNKRDGIYTDIVSGNKYQDQNNISGRMTLAIDLADNFELTLRGDFDRERETGYPAIRSVYTQDFIDAGATIPTRRDDVAFDTKPVNNLDVWGVSATAAWTGDDVSFKSITSYRQSKTDITIDVDVTDLKIFDIGFLEKSRSFTQELQLANTNPDKLEWIVGMFFLNEDGNGAIDILFNDPKIRITERNVTNAYALFGQATYSLTDRLRVTGGLRFNYEKKSYNFSTTVNGPEVDRGSPTANWTAWTPRLAVDFDITDDIMAYVSATNGFKSGGFQLGDASGYDPEKLWSYEAGLKATLFDKRLRGSLGVFNYDYTNLQVVEYSGGIATTSNAGKATVQGVEMEFVARVTEGLDINASLAYLDAKYDVFSEGGQDFAGNTLANSPKWTYSFGAQYTADVGDAGYITIRGDYAFRDTVNFARNNLPQFRAKTYTLLNARISFTTMDELWEVSLYGKNLTNNRYATYITSGRTAAGGESANMPITVFGEPRQYGVRLRRNF
ncbi:TonB-dependent receptor [hydrothermal vent metagenome]|uniref:TonB-dependent receptor n=1 Tax=hydrothermal vent metagenome TaxID=652676 RepID=A0A3B0S294_9ZZZZ